ncbi:hypothetical protein AB0J52_07765 [Spirillospora sp. NPDC049652]
MRAILNGWLLAALVAAMALLARFVLTPAEQTAAVNSQVVRVHFPWLLFCVAMTYVSASVVRRRYRELIVIAVALPVPPLVMLAGMAIRVAPGQPALGTLLQFIEALLGGSIGIVVASVIGHAARQSAREMQRAWAGDGGLSDPHGVLTPKEPISQPPSTEQSGAPRHPPSPPPPSPTSPPPAPTVRLDGPSQAPTLPPSAKSLAQNTPRATAPSLTERSSFPAPGAPLTPSEEPSAVLPEDRLVAWGRDSVNAAEPADDEQLKNRRKVEAPLSPQHNPPRSFGSPDFRQ